MPKSQKLSALVLVHPASACGSADYNLGRQTAEAERDFLVTDLNTQNPDVLVILDGFFTDELFEPKYQDLATAISNLISRTISAGHPVHRLKAPDPSHMSVMRKLVKQKSWTPDQIGFDLTGAWTNSEEDTGCVNALAKSLKALGFQTTIRDSAVDELADQEWEWLREQEGSAEPSSAKPSR